MTRPTAVAALLALISLSGSIARADGPILPDLPIESYRLANGLKVVLHRDRSVPRVTVTVAYHVGSKDERAGRTGFAHFFEHMMFRGTKNVPNYDIPLQETGGQSNAFTSEDVTVYFETIPSAYLERALYLEAERLAFLPSALDREKFDTERAVVKNERRQTYENVPYGIAEETLLANVFPKGYPYSWSVIGSMADLDAASLDDLRRFFLAYYHPGNAALCLAGDFDPAEARAWIARYFGPLAKGETPGRPAASPTPARSVDLSSPDKVALPRLYWAWPTVADGHPDAPALDLLGEILSDGDASRLQVALVVRDRLAKGVSADSDTKEIGGLFTIAATAAEGKTLDAIDGALARELDRLKADPPTPAELERALAKYEKSTYASLTSPQNRAFALAIGFLEKDDPAYYRTDLARTFKVTPDDLARVARTYLVPEKVRLRIVPIRPGEPEAKAVQAGPAPTDRPPPEPVARTPAAGPDWAILPGPAETRPFAPPAIVRKTLSNGIEVRVVPWKTLPVVVGRLIVPFGSADDPAGKEGLAQLTAAILTQGTKTRTATELAGDLDALGVSYGCSAGPDTLTLSFGVLARNLGPTLERLTPMFTEPRLDPADFARERDLHLAGLAQGPDQVNWLAQRAFRSLLYGFEHPYGKPSDGSEASVRSIGLDDIRRFHASKVTTTRAQLIVAGDVDPVGLVALLESTLGVWKAKGDRPEARPGLAETVRRPPIHLVDKPGAVQSVLRVGRRWVAKADPRRDPAAIGNQVFGVDFLSRLNRNLREKNGFSYGSSSGFLDRRGQSVWYAAANVQADATAPALREMLAEIDGLAGKNPLTDDEIRLGREAITRSFPETFEDPSSIDGLLETLAVLGLPDDYVTGYLGRIEAVKAAEVRSALADLARTEDRVVLVVGDRKTVEPALKALGLGEVRVINADGAAIDR